MFLLTADMHNKLLVAIQKRVPEPSEHVVMVPIRVPRDYLHGTRTVSPRRYVCGIWFGVDIHTIRVNIVSNPKDTKGIPNTYLGYLGYTLHIPDTDQMI